MPYLILGVGLLLGLYLVGRWYVAADPGQVRKVLLWSGATLVVLVAGFLLFTGRAAIAGAISAGLLPIIWQIIRMSRGAGRIGRRRSGQRSTVRTQFLDMALDHDSGALDGAVIAGRFEGRNLSDLDLPELIALWREVGSDAQSQQIMEAYLDREHGPDWRVQADGGSGSGAGAGRAGTGRMTMEDAREILGVGADASPDEIEAAYREAIKRNHPDAGGSSWLAAKINEARGLLLG